MRAVPGNRPVVALRHQTSLLFVVAVLRPQLEATLEVEEILIVLLVNVRQHTQAAAGRGVRAHEGEGIVGGRPRDRETIELAADGDGMRVCIVRDDVWPRRRGRVVDIEIAEGLRRRQRQQGEEEEIHGDRMMQMI